MTRHKSYDGAHGCYIEAALEVVSGKWKGVILYHLLDGTKRFNELKRLFPELSQRILTKQLRELEANRVISRKVYPEVPPKVEYSLTELGLSLEPTLRALEKWGVNYIEVTKYSRSAPQEK
ncbi:helix-turn-helix domain-containing protein [cf. Phormidesmis sp. LEGE 11477]|uniref:winged helix-turn-helix transcriptional regulator n=1 Tax=cf. Phormidesmis sp. LEGE 11477 TaxID=1828680 RepID=UPI0018826507|nr:winged helix-turn-helix transcriptional regulator [cf. Phormidesmis sp. LEGE 11477]MBE9063291.1 winged helix-turn-helix transcriptional regulator [cf. Phormidesmis sp. LEGE 11477]